MKKSLIALFLVLALIGPAGADIGDDFVFTNPDGADDTVPAGGDYALEVLGDAWDYDNRGDFTFLFRNLDGMAVKNGVLSGRSTNDDPHLFLLSPGFPSAQNIGKKGGKYPIDTTKYTLLTFRMYLSEASENAKGRLYWFTGNSTDNLAGVGDGFSVKQGWNVYSVDLTQEALSGGWQDQAQVSGLRLDPIDEGSGVYVSLDWARLTNAGGSQTYSVSWEEISGESAMVGVFYLDTDTSKSNGTLQMLHSGLDVSTANSLSVSTQSLYPDNYYVAAHLGRDYAALFLNDPWDMENDADVPDIHGASNTSISGGILSGTVDNGSFSIYLNVDPNTPIDADLFTHLIVDMELSGNNDSHLLQVYWQDENYNIHAAEPVSVETGRNTVTVDLSALSTWSGNILEFRISPTYVTGTQFKVYSVILGPGPASTAETQMIYSEKPFTVNDPPNIVITNPDERGGSDFASEVLQNPWDMEDANDVDRTDNAYNYGLVDKTFQGQPSNNDPNVYFLYRGQSTPIYATSYKYLTFRMYLDIPLTEYGFNVARVIWRHNDSSAPGVTDDIVALGGWHTYVLDLSTAVLDSQVAWGGNVENFRIDPNEEPEPGVDSVTRFGFDFVKLAKMDEAGDSFRITWADSDANDNADIKLYYDTDSSGYDGTLIAEVKEDEDTGFGPPREFRADVSGSYVNLSWKSNLDPDTDGYTLYMGASPDNLSYAFPLGNKTSAAFSNVPNGVYYLAVAAVDEDGEAGLKSRTIRVIVGGSGVSYPAEPAEFEVYHSGSSILLAWDPNSESDISSYKLHLGTSPGAVSGSIDLGKRISKEYTISNMNSDFWVSLSAVNNGGKQSPKTQPVLVGGSNQYVWDTSQIETRGQYYIYAEITDGKNSLRRYSKLPVKLR